jgi:hypothetical protein
MDECSCLGAKIPCSALSRPLSPIVLHALLSAGKYQQQQEQQQ